MKYPNELKDKKRFQKRSQITADDILDLTNAQTISTLDFRPQKKSRKTHGKTYVSTKYIKSIFDDLFDVAWEKYGDSDCPVGPNRFSKKGKAFEARFLRKHKDVKFGSKLYYKIGELIGKGYDGEDAYMVAKRRTIEG